MSTGLVLGKFAPLHRGHQLLLETAARENDRVIAIVYDSPDATNIPLPVRAGWIRYLYPQVEIFAAWDGPTEVGNTPEIIKRHDDYLREILNGERIDRFYSSEFYGDHVSKALNAIDRRIDPERRTFPVSASAIREDGYAFRKLIDPSVYRDLITKAVFLGAPSTGKTTLARELALRMDTQWMPEFGREYWEEHQVERRLTIEQLLEIAQQHRQREEEKIPDARRVLFVDTDATTTRMFSIYYHDRVHPELEQLAEDCATRYDLFFLCETDIPFEDTWDRSGEASRAVLQQQIRADLLQRRVPFITLTGDIESRVSRVMKVLSRFDRFDSIADSLIRSQSDLKDC